MLNKMNLYSYEHVKREISSYAGKRSLMFTINKSDTKAKNYTKRYVVIVDDSFHCIERRLASQKLTFQASSSSIKHRSQHLVRRLRFFFRPREYLKTSNKMIFVLIFFFSKFHSLFQPRFKKFNIICIC